MNKIWCVGLSRTGTGSLHDAMGLLGLRSVHNPPPEAMYEGDFSSLERVDAAGDIPIALWYRELDKRFARSRFILTDREPEKWADGLSRHLSTYLAATRSERACRMRIAVYGSVHPSREELLRVFDEHRQSVMDFFADRPEDLLVINICEGQGWEKLCPFLRIDAPAVPFPHEHRVNTLTDDQIQCPQASASAE